MKSNLILTLFLLCHSLLVFSQMHEYQFQRSITLPSDDWHVIQMPTELFHSLQPDLSDIRIYGITDQDTLEAPYLLRSMQRKTIVTTIPFQLLNQSKKGEKQYFTYQIKPTTLINHIQLSFDSRNFDWHVQLEGSHDLTEWYTIHDQYRILSIQNPVTSYQFTSVFLPNSNYSYYRIGIPSSNHPSLSQTSITQVDTIPGRYASYPLVRTNQTMSESKQTQIDLDLGQRVPISRLILDIGESFDYYRPIEVQYCYDSVDTEKGKHYYYRSLMRGTLTSLESSDFEFQATLCQQLRVIVQNGDNQPLTIHIRDVQGPTYELVFRVSAPASYYLVYGKESAISPEYDIVRFETTIPDTLTELMLGPAQLIHKDLAAASPSLIKSWMMWAVILIIIGLLGTFTLRMMRSAD